MFHTTIFPLAFFFFFFFHPNPPLLCSLPLSAPSSPFCPVSLSSNKAAISNWNSMLSRRAHLIYKIKLKASHARMAFWDDDDDDSAGEEKEEEGSPFSCTQSSSCHVICWFLAVTPSSCHLPWCVKCHTWNPKTNVSRVKKSCIFLFPFFHYLGNILGAFFFLTRVVK